jgi:signal peptidase I
MTEPESTSSDASGADPDVVGEGVDTVDEGDSRSKKAGKKAFRAGREIVIVIVVALVVSAVVRAFLFQAFYVPSQSMENTLLINDRILVSKIDLRLSHVKRGEIVVFKDPGGWLPPINADSSAAGVVQKGLQFVGLLPSTSEDHLVKRIIGLPGDHVKCCSVNREIVVNGKPLKETGYINPSSGTDQIQFDIVVPRGSVFVMGDNRGDSADSRYHLSIRQGGVPIADLTGRAVLRIWPANRWGTLPIPEIFKTVPDPVQ